MSTAIVEKPVSRISVLRNPRMYGEHTANLDSDLEKLIEENIIHGKHPHLQALEVRTFINSLSEDNKKKFIKIVKSIAYDKENLKFFAGEIWSGGGMRVVSGSGAALVLNSLELLSGIKPHSYIATSAGAFQAISRVFNCLNSDNLNSTIEAPFHTFIKNRDAVETWTNKMIKRASGRHDVDVFKGKHVKEIGSTFDVMVAEASDRLFPLKYMYPDIYPIFKEFKDRFGQNPDELSLAKAIGITTNLPGLICDFKDPTFGNCCVTDENGKKHYLFDPGLISKYKTPIDSCLEEIEKYKKGETKKPRIYFVIDYDLPFKNEIRKLEKQGGILKTESQSGIDSFVDAVMSIIDFYEMYIRTTPDNLLRKVGLERTYLQTHCQAINPYTKEISVVNTGSLSSPPEIRETVIGANVPLSDYKDVENSVIDQLYRNLVLDETGRESEFASTGGLKGKSAYQLILSRIDKAIGKIETPHNKIDLNGDSSTAILSAKKLLALSKTI